jgi:hypothetical protein
MWLDQLSSKPKLRLLRYLALHHGAFTGRQLALAAGVQPKRAREALAALVELGWVRERKAGRASIYTLNRHHYVVQGILIPAFARETGWLAELGRRLVAVSPPVIRSVILYGSWARGDARPNSDVDLLVVVSDRARKDTLNRHLEAFRASALDRFGVSLSFLVLSTQELADRAQTRSPFIRDILEQGRVLAGRPISDVLRSA